MPPLSVMAAEAKRKFNAAPAKKSEPPKDIFKSTEKVAESDLDSETESDSDTDSSSDSELEPPNPGPVIAKVNGNSTPKKIVSPSSSSGSEEDVDDSDSTEGYTSESGSSSSEEEESKVEVEVSSEKVSIVALPPKTESNATVTASVPKNNVPPFIPPAGFEPITVEKGAEATASQVLNSQNLDGRQVWYITAPASVPISALKRVSLHDVQKGLPSIHLNGQNYGFVQDKVEEKGLAKVMVQDGSKYCLAKRHIDRTLHLQQIVQLPTLSNTSSSHSSSSHTTIRATVPVKKSARQQPEGLKMRFLPIGGITTNSVITGVSKTSQNTSTSNKDEDVEMEDSPSTFQIPVRQPEIETERGSSSEDENTSSNESDGDEELPTNSKPLTIFESEPSSDSAESSVDSEQKKLIGPKPPQALSNGPQSAMKRKLSEMQNGTPSSLSRPPHLNSTQLKTPKTNHIKSPAVTFALSDHSKTNGTPTNVLLSPIPKHVSKNIKSTPTPPASSSITRPSPNPSTAVKAMPVPPPSFIFPPSRSIPRNRGLTAPSLRSLSSESLQPAKSPELQLKSENSHSFEEEIQAVDHLVTDKQRRKQIKRLKSNVLGRKHKTKIREGSAAKSVTGTLSPPIDTQISSQKIPPSSAIQSLLRPSLFRSVSQDKILPTTSKKKTRKIKITEDGLEAKETKQTGSAATSILPSKTISAILPPQRNISVTK